jgi:hypothetical protein
MCPIKNGGGPDENIVEAAVASLVQYVLEASRSRTYIQYGKMPEVSVQSSATPSYLPAKMVYPRPACADPMAARTYPPVRAQPSVYRVIAMMPNPRIMQATAVLV